MFLATTALSEFWDKEQEILFLGKWCLRYDRREEWQHLRYKVLPCLWNDRDRFYRAAEYLDEVYERLLEELSEYLNRVHEVSFSKRYWRIIIGPWFRIYLHILYDRYICLQEALNTYKNLSTKCLSPKSYIIPNDIQHFFSLVEKDVFNLQLYSQLLSLMGHSFPTSDLTISTGFENTHNDLVSLKSKAKSTLVSILEKLSEQLLNEDSLALGKVYLPLKKVVKLIIASKFRLVPLELKSIQLLENNIIPEKRFREGLTDISASDEFEAIFMKTLPQNFPILYLEGFSYARKRLLADYPVSIQGIMSAVGWVQAESMKFLAAEVAESGGKLIASQHGGGYGFAKEMPYKKHEESITDCYFVWGWAPDNKVSNIKNLPNPKLSYLKSMKRNSSHNFSDILLVGTLYWRYFLRFQSHPVSSQIEEYLQWQIQFIKSLPDEYRKHLLVRPYPADYGWGVRERILEQFPDTRFDDQKQIYKRFQKTRLVVIDHCMTTMLETLQYNMPTILFWQSNRYELCTDAEPYFERLKEVGILYHSPEDAAKQVAAVYEAPDNWWFSETVQNVRNEFVEHFALASENWLQDWCKELIGI